MRKYPKKILSIEEQIKTYIDAGMQIDSMKSVRRALQTIGYYRLRGYVADMSLIDMIKLGKNMRMEPLLKVF